jgi:hypothetical protein
MRTMSTHLPLSGSSWKQLATERRLAWLTKGGGALKYSVNYDAKGLCVTEEAIC